MVKRIKYFLITAIVFAGCLFYRGSAQEYVGGLLSENTVFTPALNPYIVIEPLIVPEGITLTIEPGTQVFFMVRTSLKIEGGTLIARGQASLPVLFDAQTDKKWDGISFVLSETQIDNEGNYVTGSILEYASVNYTTTGLVLGDSARLYCSSISITSGDYGIYLQSGSVLHLHNSTIDDCSYGMYVKNSGNNVVEGCMISHCDIGIFFPSNNVSSFNKILNNNLSYNTNIALFMSMGQSSIQHNMIRGNTVTYNNIGLHIGNGGSADLGFNTIESNVVQHNDIGIKLSQDADTVRANLVEMNVTGILLTRASSNHLINNLILNNVAWGLTLTDGSNGNWVSANSLYNNASGIKVTHKDFKYSIDNLFSFNSLNGNENEAFLFEAGPQQPLLSNAIRGTRDTAVFVNRFDTDLIATGNWWGTTDTSAIDSLIYDRHDNSIFGEVIYKPYLDFPDPQSPISQPRNVIKRLIGTKVKVEWIENPETDLSGYRVYYGSEGDNGFSGSVDAGRVTSWLLDDLSLFDVVAVTAYDLDADGMADQPEGHESAYSYALAGPYAGADTTICHGGVYVSQQATSPGDQYLTWSTTGDGVFDNPEMLNTAYTPGEADYAAGTVVLYLSLHTAGKVISDEIELTISGEPFVYAGADTTINQNNPFSTIQAYAVNYSGLRWSTSGDGTFSQPESMHTYYQPGEGDIAAGAARLILNLYSGCGNISDTLLLTVVASFDISGKVHRQGLPVAGGVIVAIRTGAAGVKAVSAVNSREDGSFDFENLVTGNYFLFAMTDPTINPQTIPTYYAGSQSWQGAYLLPLSTDVFDVDIDLDESPVQLPPGEASISGFFSYSGKSGDDDSIYNRPWFPDIFYQVSGINALPAANHVVLLMNPGLTRVLGWTLTASDGSFRFNQIPFGNYRLWGEKAGYTNSLSPIISLTPANKDVEGVQLTVNQKSIEISLPETEMMGSDVLVYPNPASGKLWLNCTGSVHNEPVKISFYTTDGRLAKTCNSPAGLSEDPFVIDISELHPGLYSIVIGSFGLQYTTTLLIVE